MWAPLIDRINIPILTSYLGKRRTWLMIPQIIVIISIFGMPNTDPSTHLMTMVYRALALAIGSSTQDIVVDAYRIEAGELSMQAALAAVYRIAMLVAGAGAIWLSSFFSLEESYSFYSWHLSYLIMSGFACIGLITTCLITEPIKLKQRHELEARAVDWMNRYHYIPD